MVFFKINQNDYQREQHFSYLYPVCESCYLVTLIFCQFLTSIQLSNYLQVQVYDRKTIETSYNKNIFKS